MPNIIHNKSQLIHFSGRAVKKQNTQIILKILAIGGTQEQQVGMCKTKV